MTVSPLWFGPQDRPLFGWLHAPSDRRARAGVVLCPSFAREDHKAHNAFQILAERLVTQELAVLRFDYDGMGDSAGSNLDSGRVGAWLRSTSDAIALVRRFGVPRVSLVGMRIGATIAAHAAADDGDIDQLVLWDPCLSGRAFLREQQLLSVLKLAAPTKLPDGSVETPGLLYGPDVAQDLRRLRLDSLGRPAARRCAGSDQTRSGSESRPNGTTWVGGGRASRGHRPESTNGCRAALTKVALRHYRLDNRVDCGRFD